MGQKQCCAVDRAAEARSEANGDEPPVLALEDAAKVVDKLDPEISKAEAPQDEAEPIATLIIDLNHPPVDLEAPFDERDRLLVQHTWAKASQGGAEHVGTMLFERIFEIAPTAIALFPFSFDSGAASPDMLRHVTKVVDFLGIAVNGLNDLDALKPVLQGLGLRHVGYKVLPEHYDVVCEALRQTLAAELQDDATPSVKASWEKVLRFVRESMIGEHYAGSLEQENEKAKEAEEAAALKRDEAEPVEVTADKPKALSKLDQVIQKFAEKEEDTKILIIGQTGAGKTTILNYLARFADTADLGLKEVTSQHIYDLIHGHVSDDQNEAKAGKSRGLSQTQKPKEYKIPITTKSGHTMTLLVLDTPGFGDTSGVGVDKDHEKHIVDCIKKLQFLTCVFFVISGAVTRVTATVKYSMAVITSLMPSDILQNVVIVHTFVSDKAKCKFPDQELVDSFEVPPTQFYLENPLALVMGYEEQSGKGSAARAVDKIDWSADEDNDAAGEEGRQICRLLRKSNQVVVNVLDVIADFPSYATNTIVELKQHKDKITSGLLELSWAIKSEFDLQTKLSQEAMKAMKAFGGADVYQDKWILKPSPHFHHHCEHVGCVVGEHPCCFRMEAGCGPYESKRWSNVKKLLSFGKYESQLQKDKAKAQRAGTVAGKDEVFQCPCKHPISEHIGGNMSWQCEKVLKIRKEDLSPERLREEHSKSEAEVVRIRGQVREAFGAYGRLGLPRAMRKLLTAQKMYYEELIAADKGDVKQLQDMIKDVELMQKQLEAES